MDEKKCQVTKKKTAVDGAITYLVVFYFGFSSHLSSQPRLRNTSKHKQRWTSKRKDIVKAFVKTLAHN